MKLLRVPGRIVGVLAALCVLYFAAAFILGFVPVNGTFTETRGGIPIAVCSNGVHTDFVLPVKTDAVDWSAFFPRASFPAPVEGFDHVGIGWGDLDFYRATPRWRDVKLGTALRAASGLGGGAALHVQYRPAPGAAERCALLTIGTAQYRALAEYIAGSLVASLSPVAPGYGGSDAFYPAEGRFSLIRSCNVWVGQGLKAASLPTGLWTPFAFQVLHHLQRPVFP
jgi:uncharacterized protein (TIGR02117 family)